MPASDRVSLTAHVLAAVVDTVQDLARGLTPDALLAYLASRPQWRFVQFNSTKTAQEWGLFENGVRVADVVVVVPEPSMTGWDRTRYIRKAVETLIETERVPVEVKVVVSMPEGLR